VTKETALNWHKRIFVLLSGALILFCSTATAAQLGASRGVRPKVECSALVGRMIAASDIGLPTKGARIDSATLKPATDSTVPAANSVPEVCYVRGTIFSVDAATPNIIFAVAIPTVWNQKSIQIGGNGRNGFVPLLTVLSRDTGGSPLGPLLPPNSPFPIAQGYATYGDDSGHGNGMGSPPGTAAPGGRGRAGADAGPTQDFSWYKDVEPWFQGRANGAGAAAEDPNGWYKNDGAWENFVGAHIKKAHDVAMNVIFQMYGMKPRFNYFAGQSNGGKEALIAATRYGGDYDGVQASVPLLYWSGRLVNALMIARSQYDQASWVPPAKAPAVAKETLRLCDGLDGTEDGVISNYVACYQKLDPTITKDPLAGIRCAGGADTGNDCLSDAQMAVVNSFHAPRVFGFTMANGETDWPGLAAGMEDQGWVLWREKPTPVTALNEGHIMVLNQRAKGQYQVATQDLADLKPLIQTISDQLDPRTDWSAFIKHGGKLILHASAEDYLSTPRGIMRYYQAVEKANGQASVDGMSRLYMTPMGNHGSTGYSGTTGEELPHYVDLLGLLENWVEAGVKPPDAPVTTLMDKTAPYKVISSRPLCRVPKYPKYKGSGDQKQADSYVCANP
jgi:Tannase and feruloyl esterase